MRTFCLFRGWSKSFWGFLLFTPGAYAQSLSLKDFLLAAVQSSPIYRQSLEQKKIAELQRSSATSAFLPMVSASSTYALKNDLVLKNDPPKESALAIKAQEKLYDNGQSLSAYKLSHLAEQIADLELQKAREDLANSSLKAFSELSKAQLIHKLRLSQHERLDVQYRAVKSQFEQGLRQRRDFLRFEAQVSRSQLALSRSRRSIVNAEWELKRILGREALSTLSFQELPVREGGQFLIPIKNMNETLDYQIGELKIKSAAEKVRLKVRERFPQVFLNGELGYGSSNYWGSGANLRDNDSFEARASVTLQYTFWDWGVERRAVAISRSEENIARESVRAQNLAIQTEAQSLQEDLRQNETDLKTSAQLKDLETRTFRFLEQEYREGRITYLDLSQARENFLNATESFYNSYFDGLLAKAAALKLGGRLYESIVQDTVL